MKPFFVTLVSNNIDEPNLQNGHNTLTRFTNTLADPINLETSNWYFCLYSIFFHNQYKTDNADYIKVTCDLINPYENQDNTIALIARPKQKEGRGQTLYYEPNAQEHFPVNRSIISAITIQIQANYAHSTETISPELLAGQPTVVVLKFIPQPTMAPYVIRINSHPAFTTVHTNNKPNSFRAYLGNQYNFDPALGDLEVALSSITYQPHFTTKTSDKLFGYLFDTEDETKVVKKVQFSDFSGSTIEQYIEYINDTVLQPLTKSVSVATHLDNDGIKRIRMYSKEKLIIQLPYAVLFNMGERSFIPVDGIKKADAENTYNYKIYVEPGKDNDYRFMAAPDPWAFYPDMAFIYCDFVQENLIGNVNAPILRAIPITHKNFNQQYITYSVTNLEYLAMSKCDLSNVLFELKDVGGDPLPFRNNNSSVIITILVRIIPKQYNVNKRKRVL